MKRFISLIAGLTLTVSLFAGCGSAANEAAPAAETPVAEAPAADEAAPADDYGAGYTFVVGFDAEFPPYGYQDDNGEYVGFDLELAQEVCDRLGWTLVKQPINWDSKDMELNSGAISCIWNGFTINGRESDYTWSSAYIDNTQVYVVAADSGIATVADLAGKAVLVQADSSALEALDGTDVVATFGSFEQIADYNTAFMNMEAGAADCVAMDIAVAEYQIASREAGAFVILDETISSEQYGIGFKLGNEALRDIVEATLSDMAADGTLQKIAEKWGLQDMLCFGK